ncbi:MAG: glycoside hydrolase family 99-like domain-containing protein [Gemmobacter sp.]
MQPETPDPLSRIFRFLQVLVLTRRQRRYRREILRAGVFDPVFYRGAYPQINPIYRRIPVNHYIAYGEAMGYRPNPDFSPQDYLRYNPDVAQAGMPPLQHFIRIGRQENRLTKEVPQVVVMSPVDMPVLRFDPDRPRAPFAICVHIYYPDLWPEFEAVLRRVGVPFDLYLTATFRGEETGALLDEVRRAFPAAQTFAMPNHGRDILPFVALINAGAFDGYRAVAKIHTKRSPHRIDGDRWRRHLIDGILPAEGLGERLDAFLADREAAFWVADGQHYTGTEWWGSNEPRTRDLLRRVELTARPDALSFPAGSMYWVKPLMLGMIRALQLTPEDFEPEQAQVDGTTAHAIERVLGHFAEAAGMAVRQTSELGAAAAAAPAPPSFVSAFYLPQFHPVPENDAWWGKGFTEWRSVVAAQPKFPGHMQPMLPADLGFYDLRVTEVMGEQAALARASGIDAFCVYHYWFDGRRILETPMDRLLARPEIAFPFYLCWANESWRRNWDGLSGTVLLAQTYAEGFEAALAADVARYMRDPRYARPDGRRPRFVIYRPEDMPDPDRSAMRLRAAFAAEGVPEVELGAVTFHIAGENPVDPGTFDFWIEMPPHGLVTASDYLFGGRDGNRMGAVAPGFRGLIYDYAAAARRSCAAAHAAALPPNTIAGIMPSWDNTARRGLDAHIAHGANPATFEAWLRSLLRDRLDGSYRRELFVNAWNEWAEKAVMEPSQRFGRLYLDVLAAHTRSDRT